MNCDSIPKLIPLYYYGELTPDEEERVEEHTHECAACAGETGAAARAGRGARQAAASVPAPILLEDCRERPDGRDSRRRPARRTRAEGPVAPLPGRLSVVQLSDGMARLRQPIGALALIAIGFFAARLI